MAVVLVRPSLILRCFLRRLSISGDEHLSIRLLLREIEAEH